MELVIFTGMQASGKSTFYRGRFGDTHVRINLDMLRTRYRQKMLFETCLLIKQSCVIDNTNILKSERQVYIAAAKASGFGVVGYYFQSKIDECLARNALRAVGRVPDVALRNVSSNMEIPDYSEGYDALYYVRLCGKGFEVKGWWKEETDLIV